MCFNIKITIKWMKFNGDYKRLARKQLSNLPTASPLEQSLIPFEGNNITSASSQLSVSVWELDTDLEALLSQGRQQPLWLRVENSHWIEESEVNGGQRWKLKLKWHDLHFCDSGPAWLTGCCWTHTHSAMDICVLWAVFVWRESVYARVGGGRSVCFVQSPAFIYT